MIYNNYYNIALLLNNQEVDITPTEYSFSLKESIHSFYNSAVLEMNDLSSSLQEYLATMEGFKIEIQYGINEILNKCKYIISQDKFTEQKYPGILSGNPQINLIHEWFNSQESKSKSYKDRISNIVREIANTYSFSSININDTGNNDYWYQTLMTDAKFIEEVLKPNAYSINSNKTPFYSFITSNNTYNFKNYNSMFIDRSKLDLSLKESFVDQVNENVILSIQRESKDVLEYKKDKYKNIFKINRTTGELISEDLKIEDVNKINNKKLPYLYDEGLVTGFEDQLFNETDVGRKENLKGQLYNSYRDKMNLQTFICTIPFKPSLHAGNTIDLEILTIDTNNSKTISNLYSGKYLIESLEHIWNGKQQSGFTFFLCSRKNISVPTTYTFQPFLKSS